MKQKLQYDVPALAAALTRLLERADTSHRNQYRSSASAYYWGGKMTGVGGLFRKLVDSKYQQVIERPHESGEMRKFLKESAVELHRDHDLLVSMNGSMINISFASHIDEFDDF